ADLGTGSGAIALALASEREHWVVTAVDSSAAALGVAAANARRLDIANVEFVGSDWFAALDAERFDAIVSNPPYVADCDPHLDEGDVRFEPRAALVAGADGLSAIREIISAAPGHLVPGGWLLLEHGAQQGEAVRGLLAAAGFAGINTRDDLAGLPRITGGCIDAG
ncbi:MAG: peptide chain release factor N(5)-glutamine methyltransferase, partial [Xanthomonadales bacterium]|nr:peptide chain release factor N(5)-glutamine methyltransferase [Xanthomonadales bacterium]